MASVIRICPECKRLAHQDTCPECEQDELMTLAEVKQSLKKWRRRKGVWGEYMTNKLQALLDTFLVLQGDKEPDKELSPVLH